MLCFPLPVRSQTSWSCSLQSCATAFSASTHLDRHLLYISLVHLEPSAVHCNTSERRRPSSRTRCYASKVLRTYQLGNVEVELVAS